MAMQTPFQGSSVSSVVCTMALPRRVFSTMRLGPLMVTVVIGGLDRMCI